MEPTVSLSHLPTLEIDVDSIIVGDRVRQDFGDIEDLAQSIADHGLIQPVVVTSDHRLIAGERRLRAHKFLGFTKIRAVYLEVVDNAHLTILEATENIQRRDFTWQERVLAVDKVHQLNSTAYALKSQNWGVRETGRLLGASKSNIGRAVFIAPYIKSNDPDIAKADSLKTAYEILLKRREAELAAELVKQTIPQAKPTNAKSGTSGTTTTPRPVLDFADIDTSDASFFDRGSTGFTPGIGGPGGDDLNERPGTPRVSTTEGPTRIPLSQMFHRGDSVELLRAMPAEVFDAVITDWPYGNDMSMIQQTGGGMDVSATATEHAVPLVRQVHLSIIPEIYRVLKPNSFFITFADISLDEDELSHTLGVVRLLNKTGFKVQRWPLIWHKTSVCQNMAANQNFTKNYEVAIVCRKGNATLVRPQASAVFTASNDSEARALNHPFAKPFALWEWVYNATCLRGASVLDPFVGSGSSGIAAVRCGLRSTGLEVNETHYNNLILNMQNLYKSLDPKCEFS